MRLTDENALLASLVGSKVVKSLPRFAAVQNELNKHVLPPIPFLPLQNEVHINEVDGFEAVEAWKNDRKLSEEEQFFPFSFKRETEEQFYLLPWEPMINISMRNIISKRYVSKSGSKLIGSIKERMGTDDIDITITGALFGERLKGSYVETYPREDMERLRDYMLTAERLQVKCEPLQLLGINYIVIEEMSFPFTKGENVQAYEIKAISDFDWDLIYKRNNTDVNATEFR